MALFAPYLPLPQQRPLRLLAVDTPPTPRPFAECLEDGGYIYAPVPAPSARSPLPSGIPVSLTWPSCLSGEDDHADPSLGRLPGCPAGRHTSQNAAPGEAKRPIVRWLQIQAQANPSWRADQTPVVADSRHGFTGLLSFPW